MIYVYKRRLTYYVQNEKNPNQTINDDRHIVHTFVLMNEKSIKVQ